MNLQPRTPDAGKLAVLVNPEKIRSSVKRLFRNNISEIFGEIFQNSCRAGAKKVRITITPDGFSVQDDGHGILNGIDGFHTLLKLAESSFDNPTIDDQDPMGIGIASLLTHDQIEEVTFASGTLTLSLDPNRWWHDSDYYSTWFERITEMPEPVSGFLINVRCKPELIPALKTALDPKDSYLLTSDVYKSTSPAQGYEGILKITLDGKPVRTSLPVWATCRETLIRTKYQECPITIGYDSEYSRKSCVRWYGQLIEVRTDLAGFRFYLDVQKGRPVNPLSPSRAGLIQDNAYKGLLQFVKDEVFRFVLNTENRNKIKAAHVNTCFSIDKTRAIQESPYITARAVKPIDNPSSFDEAQLAAPEPVIFTYDEVPTLLAEYVKVIKQGETTTNEYGLHSFVPMLDKPHFLQNGDESRLRIGRLYWQPGRKKRAFYKKGTFGISYVADQPPTEWKDITHAPVFVFNDPGTTLDYIDLIAGTDDPIAFLQNEVWAAFCPSDDYDHDPQEDSFRDSCDAMIRDLVGKCVARHFRHFDLEQFLKEGEGVAQLTYRYPRGTFKKDGTLRSSHPVATGIILHTSTGRQIKLKFYG